jgi:hypothetical protein
MAATMQEAPRVGASDLADLLEPELSAAEAQAIVREFLARAVGPPVAPIARACRCLHAWEFERGRCAACGHELARRTA